MPISQSDQLFQLVKSLTKAEKRNFTFYTSRIQDSDSLKYMQLFEMIDKQKDVNDNLILGKLKGVDKNQYSNLKRHLVQTIDDESQDDTYSEKNRYSTP
jgi:flagellar biosynthesis chaperone FliJ